MPTFPAPLLATKVPSSREPQPPEPGSDRALIRRTFLPWDEPALPRVADVLAERYGDGGGLDMSAAVVVLPGARPGRRLGELLVERAERESAGLTPPRVVTVRHLPELLYQPEPPTADGVLARRIWSLALRELDGAERDAVLPDPPPGDDAARWEGLARLVHGLHRELAGEGHDFAEVARRCRDGGAFDDGRRWSALATAQRAYRDALEELGRQDREEARLRALEEGAPALEGDLWLVGVVELPGVTAAMVRALDGAVRVVVHAPEERADAFDDLGLVVPEAWAGAEIPLTTEEGRVDVEVCGRPSEQADAVVRALSGDGPEIAPDQVSVGVPDRALVPYLEQRLEAFDLRHRHAAGTPLDRTRPYLLLEALGEYLRTRRFEELAALLRHPDVEATLPTAAVLDGADSYFSRHLPASGRPAGSLRSGEAGRFRAVLRELSSAVGLDALSGRRRLSDWMPSLLDLLVRVYGGEPLHRSKPGERRLLAACEKLRQAAADLHALPREVDEPCGPDAAIRLLLGEVRDAAVPPDPDRTAIEMLGWLELHLDDAPELVITGFDDEHVPERVGADAFLPNALRRRLGLVHDERRYARDAYLLQAILRSRRRTRIVLGRQDAEGNPRRPSRLLLAASGEELARRADELFRERDRAPGATSRLGVEPGERSGFRPPPEPVIEIDPPSRVRVTDFRLLLADPYRWALRRQLELEEQDDRARELDPLGFGDLAHEVLRRFGEGERRHSEDPEEIRRELTGLLSEAVRSRFGPSPLPAVRIQIEILRLRLAAFAGWQAERRRRGWRIEAVEAEPEGDGVPFDVDGDPVLLAGRIDRVERHEERDEWALLDYKTGEKPREPDRVHRRGGEWVDLQLPLYRHLLGGIAEAGRLSARPEPDATVRLGYVNLPRTGEVSAEMAGWSGVELEEAREAARRAVRRLREGRIAFEPGRKAPWRHDPLSALLGEDQIVTSVAEDDREAEDG